MAENIDNKLFLLLNVDDKFEVISNNVSSQETIEARQGETSLSLRLTAIKNQTIDGGTF